MYFGTDDCVLTPSNTAVPYDSKTPVVIVPDAIPQIHLWKAMAAVQKTTGVQSETYGADGTSVKSNLRTSLAYPQVKLTGTDLLDSLVKDVALAKFRTRLKNLSAEWDIISYTVGGEFVLHHDSGYLDVGTKKVVTLNSRKLTGVLYFNTQGESFLGGDIEFPYLRDTVTGESLKVKPVSGTLVVFPSNHSFSHIVHPVTLGTRVCAVKFFE